MKERRSKKQDYISKASLPPQYSMEQITLTSLAAKNTIEYHQNQPRHFHIRIVKNSISIQKRPRISYVIVSKSKEKKNLEMGLPKSRRFRIDPSGSSHS